MLYNPRASDQALNNTPTVTTISICHWKFRELTSQTFMESFLLRTFELDHHQIGISVYPSWAEIWTRQPRQSATSLVPLRPIVNRSNACRYDDICSVAQQTYG